MTVMSQVHPFERAGFGHAPYRFVGYSRQVYQAAPDAPVQPGTSCDYCGTGIMDVFRVRSRDGVEFKVGCDCIRRVHAEFNADIPVDARAAIAQMEREKRDAKRQAAWEKAIARGAAALAILESRPTLFADRPHPNSYFAGKGLTYRDYLTFLLGSGATGRTTAAREIERAANA